MSRLFFVGSFYEKIIDQSPNNVSKNYYQNPDYFIVGIFKFSLNSVNKHYYPENK